MNRNDSEIEIFTKYFSKVNQEQCKNYIANRIELKKSDGVAKINRLKGNKCYSQKEFMEAVCYYNESIAFAVPNMEEYSLALANRSAAHFELKNWKECLVDVDRVLKCGKYPEEKLYKLYLRKTNCLLFLEQPSETKIFLKMARKSFENVKHNLNAITIDEYIKKMYEIDKKLEDDENENNTRNDFQTSFPYFTENANVLNSAKYFDLRKNFQKGRHVVAREDIKEGDILFIEEPYAVSVPSTRERFAKYCRNCFKLTSAYISCNFCTDTLYCCEECRVISWEKEHQWECFGMRTRVLDGANTLLLSILFRSCRNGFADSISDKPVFAGEKDNYPSVNNLITHKERIPANVLRLLTKIATFLVIYLIHYTNFFDWFKNQSKQPRKLKKLHQIAGGFLLKYAMQNLVNCDSINIFSVQFESPFDANIAIERDIAIGLFVTTSMINHSCVPNAMKSFHGHVKIIRAITNIKKGAEITISYVDSSIDDLGLVTIQRKSIQEIHFFDCICLSCINEKMFSPWLCLICNNKTKVNDSFIFGPIIYCEICRFKIPSKEYSEIDNKITLSEFMYERTHDCLFLNIMNRHMKDIYSKDDIKFYELNKLFASHYRITNLKKCMEYVRLNINLVKQNYGDITIGYLKSIIIYSALILKYCLSLKQKNSRSYGKMLAQAQDVFEKSVYVLQFYTTKENIDSYKNSILAIRKKYDLY